MAKIYYKASDENSPVEELRAEYKGIRERAVRYHGIDEATFDQDVRALMTRRKFAVTPWDFVRAARAVSYPCERCRGTGIYSWGPIEVMGGGPKYSGDCFRCQGKGQQNDADARRNYGYDNFFMRGY